MIMPMPETQRVYNIRLKETSDQDWRTKLYVEGTKPENWLILQQKRIGIRTYFRIKIKLNKKALRTLLELQNSKCASREFVFYASRIFTREFVDAFTKPNQESLIQWTLTTITNYAKPIEEIV